jgi:hypothetical protein
MNRGAGLEPRWGPMRDAQRGGVPEEGIADRR